MQVCGTPMYMSPEAVSNHQYTVQQQNGQDPAAPRVLPGLENDWWMLGNYLEGSGSTVISIEKRFEVAEKSFWQRLEIFR